MCLRLDTMPHGAKTLCAYFTPEAEVDALPQWAVRSSDYHLLDPWSGDGRFVARHPKNVSIERELASVIAASDHAPSATVLRSDFFM